MSTPAASLPVFIVSSSSLAGDPGKAAWGAEFDRVAESFTRIIGTTSRLVAGAYDNFKNEGLAHRLAQLASDGLATGASAAGALKKKLDAAVAAAREAARGTEAISFAELARFEFGADVAASASAADLVSRLGNAAPFRQTDVALRLSHLRDQLARVPSDRLAFVLDEQARAGRVDVVAAADSVAPWVLTSGSVDMRPIRVALRRALDPESFAALEVAERWQSLLAANQRTFRTAIGQTCNVSVGDDPVAGTATGVAA